MYLNKTYACHLYRSALPNNLKSSHPSRLLPLLGCCRWARSPRVPPTVFPKPSPMVPWMARPLYLLQSIHICPMLHVISSTNGEIQTKLFVACWGTQSQDQTTSGWFRHLGASAKIPGVWPSIHQKKRTQWRITHARPLAFVKHGSFCLCLSCLWRNASSFSMLVLQANAKQHKALDTPMYCLGATMLSGCYNAGSYKLTCWRDGSVWGMIYIVI